MRGRRASWIGLMLIALAAGPGLGLEIDFQASVDRTRSGQDDPIRLILSIRSDENIAHLPAPEIELQDFQVEGPAVSTRLEMINFETTFTRELIYTLYPRRTGRIAIGPARLKLGGKVYETKPIAVEIVPGSVRQKSPSSRPSTQPSETSVDDNLFLRARADRRQAYVGQQITVDYDLCYRVRLENVGFKELPSFTGFWAKELFVAQQLIPHREEFGNVPFNVAPLRQLALFPTSAGRHRVEPLTVTCDVPQRLGRRGSLFEDFFNDPLFGGATRTVLVRSEPLEFEVRPLPEIGRPPEFMGAVGRFSLSVQAQPTTLPAGEPVTLRVELSGQGNLGAVKIPPLSHLPGFKVYDPKVQEEEKVENGVYGGRRLYEYILIPERGGTLMIAPIRFAYFDPEQGLYRRLESAPIAIHSQGGIGRPEAQEYEVSRRDIEAVGQDIRHIKPDVEELGSPVELYKSGIFWGLQGVLPLALLGLALYQRHQRRLEGDVAYARRRRARGQASRRLKRAEELLAAKKGAEFYAEVQRALFSFLADRLNLAAAGLTSEISARVLAERGVEEELIERLRDLLAQCDFARFAPTSSSPLEMERVLACAKEFIDQLERQI